MVGDDLPEGFAGELASARRDLNALQEIADALEAEWYTSPRPAAPAPVNSRIRIVLEAPAELLTMNAARGGRIHWRVWAQLTRAWRDAMAEKCLLLGLAPASCRLGIEAYPHQHGGNMADPGAHMPCVKACIDGLRDAGVLVDDSGKHVAWIRCWPPVNVTDAAMVLDLVPVP